MITTYQVTMQDGSLNDFVQIQNSDGGFTSMLKETYEAQQAAQAQTQAEAHSTES